MGKLFEHIVLNTNGQAIHVTRGPQLATVTKVTGSKTTAVTVQIPRSIK
jgi:hypothetical protein